MRTLADWVSYINSLHTREIDLGLERIKNLAQALQLDRFSCPVIVVGGTNGKGSVVKFIESIYLAAGYQVAAYTSPHLLHFNERLRINGQDVSDEKLIAAFNYVEQHRQGQSLTFFEFTTLAIFYICQQLPLEVLILEVGLGGRLDAVNIVDADVSVITNVDIDHKDFLGDTRELIGREKAGIARADKPLVCGDINPPQTVIETIQQLSTPFFVLGKQFNVRKHTDSWDWIGPDLSYLRLPLPELKIENAATSLMVIDLLQTRLPVTQYAVIIGVKRARLPGRFERMPASVPLIFDVAHNPQAVEYLGVQLQQQSIAGKTKAVVGMLADKEIEACLAVLMGCVDGWYIAGLEKETTRGASAQQLSNYLGTKTEKSCYNFASVGEALSKAMADSQPTDRIVIFGSFYTVALAKQHLVKERNDGSQRT